MAEEVAAEVAAGGESGWPALWRWLGGWMCRWKSRPARQLRLCETLALGEKRFLAVVECGPQKFLIGGAGNSVVLLTRLNEPSPRRQNVKPQIEVVEAGRGGGGSKR